MNKDLYQLSYSLRKDFQKKVFTVVFSIILVVVSLNLILTFLIFPLRANSVSMEPDITRDSVILFTPLNKTPSRGDVILLKRRNQEKRSAGNNLANSILSFFSARQFSLDICKNLMGDQDQIRRVIGVPGDTIYMRDYVMYIRPARHEHFLTEFEMIDSKYNVNINAAPSLWDASIGVAGSFDEITLGNGQYFVLGDSRNSSVDSRLWGPVDSKSFKANALLCYFPLNKIKKF